MTVLDPTAKCTSSTHFISDHAAVIGAITRCPTCRQLLEIQKTETTSFYFSMPCHDHFLAVQVEICPDPECHSYKVFVRDVPCHETVEADDMNDLIRRVCNSVVLIPWDLRSDCSVTLSLCRQSHAPRQYQPELSCFQRTHLNLSWLGNGRSPERHTITEIPGQGGLDGSLPAATSPVPPPSRSRKKRRRNDDGQSDVSNVGSEPSIKASRKTNQKRNRKDRGFWPS